PFNSRVGGAQEHALAQRPRLQRGLAHCMCLGACIVSIFPSPTTAIRLGGPFFSLFRASNPNPSWDLL
ncbi:hypothetical protein B0H16DRAFT_1266683, partial [Mycena metata]